MRRRDDLLGVDGIVAVVQYSEQEDAAVLSISDGEALGVALQCLMNAMEKFPGVPDEVREAAAQLDRALWGARPGRARR